MLVKALKWPVISLLITGGTHFIVEAVLPDLKNVFVPSVLAPLLLAFGIWAGYKTVQFGGNYVQVIVAGVIVGLLPLLLDIVGFGLILGRGLTVGVQTGIFGFGMILFGALIGGGFALGTQGAESAPRAER
jgi:hypothetical protein